MFVRSQKRRFITKNDHSFLKFGNSPLHALLLCCNCLVTNKPTYMEPVFILQCIQQKSHPVSLKEILFLKAKGKYCTLHTDSKEIMLNMGISTMFKKLPIQHFSFIHRSYVVAWKRIKQLTSKWILIGNEKIPLSRRKRKEIFQLFSL